MAQQESNQRPYNNNYPHQEDEINLIDYLLVLWKWKWLIIGGTFICFISAAMISLIVPKIYTISMPVEPVITGLKSDGYYTYLDFMGNAGSKINEGLYNNEIIEQLKKSPLKTSIEFNAGEIPNLPLIIISSQWDENDIDFGLEASKQLIALVSRDYRRNIEALKNTYDKEILKKQDAVIKLDKKEKKDIDGQRTQMLDQITRISKQIKFEQEILNIINQRIGELTSEVAKVENNTKKMTEQRDGLLKENPATERIALLLYSTTIQQNMAYSNSLHDEVYNLRKEERKVSGHIEEQNGNVDSIKSEIERMKVHKPEALQAKIDKIMEVIEDLELSKQDWRPQIDKFRAELETLKLEKAEVLQDKIDKINEQIDELKTKREMVRNIRLVKNPSPEPVKSKKKMIVLLSGVVGFFFFIFLAFCVEYIKSNLSKFK